MVKRVIIDVAVGAVLAFVSQIVQFGAYLLLLGIGYPMPYESAPPDPGAHPDWVAQINMMSLVSAVLVLLLSVLAAWLLRTRDLNEGLRRGLIWAGVVILWHLVIGLANGTMAAFGIYGVWVYFAAFALGAIVVGWLRGRRATA